MTRAAFLPRWTSACLLASLLLSAGLAGAQPFLQESADAAKTGAVDGLGPMEDEVALHLRLPGGAAGQVLILDGSAFVLTRDVADQGLREDAIWRIELATGEIERWLDLEPPRSTPCSGTVSLTPSTRENCYYAELASDGTHLYLARDGGIDKLSPDGEHVGSWEHPALYGEATASSCRNGLAIDEQALFALCQLWPAEQVEGERAHVFPGSAGRVVVARVTPGPMEERWVWVKDARSEALGQPLPGAQSPDCPEAQVRPCPGDQSLPFGLAVVGGTLSLVTYEESGQQALQAVYWGLDKETGDFLWSRNASTQPTPDALAQGFVPTPLAKPTGTPDELYLRIGSQIQAVNPARGDTVLWREPIGARDPEHGAAPTGMGLRGNDLYVPSFQTLHKIDTTAQSLVWQTTLPDQAFAWEDLIVTSEAVYLTALGSASYRGAVLFSTTDGDGYANRTIYAFHPETGEALFGHDLAIRITPDDVRKTALRYAVSDGLLVAATEDGQVVILGRTEASLTAEAAFSETYPAPGKEVSVDLSGSLPGAFGAPTRYKADWGDGTLTDWTRDPVLTHTYNDTGPHEATFWAGNEARQTSVVTQTFDVGGTPPVEPNLIETAFVRENQDMTFGVLGILLAIGGAIIGTARHRRQEREAEAAEERLVAYREALEAEVHRGTPFGELSARLRPIRAALGISDRQHARMEQTLRTRLGDDSGLVVGDAFLGRYEVIEHLGTGGGGSAYLCQDVRIGRQVAVKAIGAARDGVEREGIVDEAAAFATIDDPGVVRLHDIEQVGDEIYLVLEHVPGGNLSERLSQGSLDEPGFQALATDLLSGLGAIHEAGVVHRDVKPANVLVTSAGRFKLADFGIAGREPGASDGEDGQPSTRHTVAVQVDSVRGTIPYMSPEQARGQRVDRRSDLYSATVVLWEAWMGERYVTPEPGETATELQMRIAQADGLPRVPDEASEALAAWFARALDPNPEARFQTASEMRAALPVKSSPGNR